MLMQKQYTKITLNPNLDCARNTIITFIREEPKETIFEIFIKSCKSVVNSQY